MKNLVFIPVLFLSVFISSNAHGQTALGVRCLVIESTTKKIARKTASQLAKEEFVMKSFATMRIEGITPQGSDIPSTQRTPVTFAKRSFLKQINDRHKEEAENIQKPEEFSF